MGRRGFTAIGMECPKVTANLGGLFRSGHCFGVSYIFTVGDRYKSDPTDTTKATRHLPYFRYHDLADFREHLPAEVTIVGVELTDDAVPLEQFIHPERAIYVLGPEDGSLSDEMQKACDVLVKFGSRFCLNVASAGSVVLYDRHLKES